MAGSMRWRTRKPPSRHQPCVNPVSSRSLWGSAKKIWQETAKTPGSAKPSRSGARKPGATRMSLFSSTTTLFAAARMPALEPPPKPRFAGSATTLTRGNAAVTYSALPSVEPLSTTTISLSGLPARASITEGRYFSRRSLPFQLGITTEAADGTGFTWPESAGAVPARLAPQMRPARSTKASVTAAMAIRNGETSSSRTRFSTAISDSRPHTDLPAQLDPSRRTDVLQLLFQPVSPRRAPDKLRFQLGHYRSQEGRVGQE